jgi:acetyl-CoA acetyltransferase family protein
MNSVAGQERPEVVIVDAVRTGIGRGHPEKGQYRDVHANELLGTCFRELFARTGVDPVRVDDVISGCVLQYGEQSINIARNAWLQAGLPPDVPATTVDRQCGSGQQAVNFAAALIGSGAARLVVASGVEHMSRVPFRAEEETRAPWGTPWPQTILDRYELVHQGIAAERVAERWEIERAEMDRLALRSHHRAARATLEGRFVDEVVPITVNGTAVVTDQGIRAESTLEALGALPPAFQAGGHVTAGNASQVSDGAAALLLAERRAADELGLPVLARIVDHIAVGSDPVLMLTGPVAATRALLARNGLSVGDVDRYEVNEAFASVLGMWQRELAPDPETVNVNGGAIALGHPLGASGARLITSLAHELRRAGAERGVVTMCCRGGLGTATLLERGYG